MKINKKMLKIVLFCILMSVTQISFSVLNYNEVIQKIGKIVRYFIYFALFLINAFELKKEDLNIKYIALGILSVIVVYFSHNTYLLITIFIIWAMRNVDFKEILKYAVPTLAITFFVIVVMSLVGIIPNWSSPRFDGHMRYYLGYQFATVPATYYFTILLLRFYQKGKKIDILEIIDECLIAIYLYLKTDSKTGLLLALLVLIVMTVYKYSDKLKIKKIINKKSIQLIIKTICIVLPVLMVLISIGSTFLYGIGNKYAIKVDKMLTGRLKYSLNGLLNNNVKLFGSKVNWMGWGGYGFVAIENFKYNFVDNSYIYLLIDCGAVFLIILTIGYIVLLQSAYEKRNYKLIIAISFILIWSLIEPNILNLDKNVFLLLFSEILTNKHELLKLKRSKDE